MPRDEEHLLDILVACRRLLSFKEGFDRPAFGADLKTQSAVLHQLLVLGEAVKRVSTETRGKAPEIPWSLIAGMRDHLIHGYDAVDLDEVWSTADRDIPALIVLVERLLGHD